jgi:hypothetical protein
MNVQRFLVASALLAAAPLLNSFAFADVQTIPGFSSGNATYSTITVTGDPVNITAGTDLSGNSTLTFTHQGTPTWTGPNDGSVASFTVNFTNPVTAVGLSFDGSATGGTFLAAGATVGETIEIAGPVDANHPTGLWDYVLSDLASPNDGLYAFGDGTKLLSLNYLLPYPVTSITVKAKSIDTSETTGIATISTVTNSFIPSGGATPEPASLGILAAGGAMLLTRRRSR